MNMKKSRMPKMDSSMRPEGMAMPRFGARAMRPGGMAKGGKVHPDAAMDKKLIRKEIARAEKMEHKSEKKEMKKGGMVMPSKDSSKKDLMAIKDTPVGRRMASAAVGVKKMMRGGNPGMPMQQQGGGRPFGESNNLGTAGGPGGGRPAGMLPRPGGRPPGGSMNLGSTAGPGGGRPGNMTQNIGLSPGFAGSGKGPVPNDYAITQQALQRGAAGPGGDRGKVVMPRPPQQDMTQKQMQDASSAAKAFGDYNRQINQQKGMGLGARPGGMPSQQTVGQGIAAGLGGDRRPGGLMPQQDMTQQQMGSFAQQYMQGMGLFGRPSPGMKKGGAVRKMAKGGGVERKGKTKGKFI